MYMYVSPSHATFIVSITTVHQSWYHHYDGLAKLKMYFFYMMRVHLSAIWTSRDVGVVNWITHLTALHSRHGLRQTVILHHDLVIFPWYVGVAEGCGVSMVTAEQTWLSFCLGLLYWFIMYCTLSSLIWDGRRDAVQTEGTSLCTSSYEGEYTGKIRQVWPHHGVTLLVDSCCVPWRSTILQAMAQSFIASWIN